MIVTGCSTTRTPPGARRRRGEAGCSKRYSILLQLRRGGRRACASQLDDVGADMVRLVTATQDMMSGTLGEALETVQADAAAVATAPDVPRMMFFSGMVGGEIMQLVDLWTQMDVGGCIFACAVPSNWDGRLDELVVEISEDHQMMMEREATGQGVPEEEEFTEYKAESVKNRA